MHKIIINKLGPIDHCELTLDKYCILTGYQASGKSTIAKAVYFFSSIKNDIFKLVRKRQLYKNGNISHDDFIYDFFNKLEAKFIDIFGPISDYDINMKVTYLFKHGVELSVFYNQENKHLNYNFSNKINELLFDLSNNYKQYDLDLLKDELNIIFDDLYETVYIPAGRSILTVLGSQFNYFYSILNDDQKGMIDSSTRDYYERVMGLRPLFSNGLEGLLEGRHLPKDKEDLVGDILELIYKILKGQYIVSNGEERVLIQDENRSVKIDHASSGQQESVWILNLLYYYYISQKPTFFIIEEPESNLFPESQKLMVELIAMVANAGNEVLVTTHSPYVLGAFNNLLYAGNVGQSCREEIDKVISSSKWIDSRSCVARFVKEGTAIDCLDPESKQIDNTMLDQISHIINREYDLIEDIEDRHRSEDGDK